MTAGLRGDQQQVASQWQDKDGSLTPPGHWMAIAIGLARRHGLSSSATALALALVATAQADAFIAAWDAKYAYWSVRPVTAIRERDSDWRPYIDTPHFPSYVSGHATTSGAAATVLAALFPEHAAELHACAEQASESRLLGGIHFRSDNEAGLQLGREVGAVAMARVSLAALGWRQPRWPGDALDVQPVGCLWPDTVSTPS